MSRTAAIITTLVILTGLIVGLLFWQERTRFEPQITPRSEAPPDDAIDEPAIRYPVPAAEAPAEPLPQLDESDPSFESALSSLVGPRTFRALYQPQSLVRRIVVTVDNLPREVVADRLRPIQPAQGRFLVQHEGNTVRIAPDNAKRYTPYVRALEAVNVERFTQVYARFYPLFQDAYRDLGYPNAYFNDRLVAVIDHMLAAPELSGPPQLVQPHVFYRYADPALESASAGHKLMWRIGNENARRVKAKLREIRTAVTAHKPE
ncbi:MAG TPA: DUF3014 domain-containing protein [Noviherbaspirillum sp.]|nr:DUF3014 domain-containing protein [Noviherbaspirillum sp.]